MTKAYDYVEINQGDAKTREQRLVSEILHLAERSVDIKYPVTDEERNGSNPEEKAKTFVEWRKAVDGPIVTELFNSRIF